MRNKYLVILTLVLFVAIETVALSAGPSGYHINKKAVLGGEGGWDYLTVDSKARRVYISRGTHVMMVDADSYAVLGDIPGNERRSWHRDRVRHG